MDEFPETPGRSAPRLWPVRFAEHELRDRQIEGRPRLTPRLVASRAMSGALLPTSSFDWSAVPRRRGGYRSYSEVFSSSRSSQFNPTPIVLLPMERCVA